MQGGCLITYWAADRKSISRAGLFIFIKEAGPHFYGDICEQTVEKSRVGHQFWKQFWEDTYERTQWWKVNNVTMCRNSISGAGLFIFIKEEAGHQFLKTAARTNVWKHTVETSKCKVEDYLYWRTGGPQFQFMPLKLRNQILYFQTCVNKEQSNDRHKSLQTLCDGQETLTPTHSSWEKAKK